MLYYIICLIHNHIVFLQGAKPDPVAVLRKQLDEAQAALADEKSNLASAQSKIKEITGKWAHAEKVSSTTGGQVAELQVLPVCYTRAAKLSL